MKRIYLSSPHMGGEELSYIREAFDTNWIAPLGANVNGFEGDLQAYTGRKQAAVVTSGTAAIHLGLILCGVKPGSEVICQSFTFVASANPIRYQGATPVFVDSEPETWNMDPELLEKAIVDRMRGRGDKKEVTEREGERVPEHEGERPPEHEGERLSGREGERAPEHEGERVTGSEGEEASLESPSGPRNVVGAGETGSLKLKAERKMGAEGRKPKAIVVVHLYGVPAKMDEILEIAAKYDIPVIEDAAEALGSTLNGRKCGTYGKLSVFSFNGNKIITTSGGGALLSDDEQLVGKARFLATQARDDAPHYQHSELGYNYRMSNIVAGIGRGQMKVIDERMMQRRANHQYYFESLGKTWFNVPEGRRPKMKGNREPSALFFELSDSNSPTGIYFLKEPENCKCNRWLTTILVNPEETGGRTRDDIRQALEKENIECRPLWKPMHLQPLYEDYPFYGNGISDGLFEYGLCLPSASNLSDEDRERVVAAIGRILRLES